MDRAGRRLGAAAAARRAGPDLGVTKGDAIIHKIDLSLRDEHVTQPAIYEAEYATLLGTDPHYTYTGASGPGAVPLPKGASATFWVYSPTDGESTVSVDHLGGGHASVALNGEKLDVPKVGGAKKGTDTVRLFLSGGINKITVTGTSRELVLDRLRVARSEGTLVPTVYQAENGTLSGAGRRSSPSRAPSSPEAPIRIAVGASPVASNRHPPSLTEPPTVREVLAGLDDLLLGSR
jgi:hypothetical protein